MWWRPKEPCTLSDMKIVIIMSESKKKERDQCAVDGRRDHYAIGDDLWDVVEATG